MQRVPPRRLVSGYFAFVLVTSATLTAWFALSRGQDANWDQRNYHLAIPALIFQHTFWSSIAPAGIQSYFNPDVIEAEAWAIRDLPPRIVALGLALLQSVTFAIAGFICLRLRKPADGAGGIALSALGFLLSLASPVALSEAGTTMTDLLTAAPVLLAYATLLSRDGWLGPRKAGLLAGVLLGMASALKLTNGIFAVGTAGFAFAGAPRLRERAGWIPLSAIGFALAFAAIAGPWQIALWRHFGNPVFPYFFAGGAMRDARFLPHSWLDVGRWPLDWLLGGSPDAQLGSPGSEMPVRDPRWMLVVVGTLMFLATFARGGEWARARLRDPGTGLLAACAIDYLVWIAAFGILRYAIALEILCGAILLFLIDQLGPLRLRLGVALAVCAISGTILRVPDWGHLPWGAHWRTVGTTALAFERPSLVFLTVKPTAYAAASLPPRTRYVGIYGDLDLRAGGAEPLARLLDAALTDRRLALMALERGPTPPPAAAILASRGLRATARCRDLHLADDQLRLCDVDRTAAP
jgi:hypothetical protein